MRGKSVASDLAIEIIMNEDFCVVYKLLEIYNMKCIIHIIYISPKGTGNISACTAKISVITKSIA
jgi:hypothetical protein